MWLSYYLFGAEFSGKEIVGITGLLTIPITLVVIASQGFTLRALVSVAVTIAIVTAVAAVSVIAIFATVAGAVASAGAVTIAVASAVASTVASVITIVIASSISFTVTIAVSIVTIAVSIVVSIAGIRAVTGAAERVFAIPFGVTFAVTFFIISFLLSFYIDYCIHKQNPKFKNLRVVNLIFSALGGTNFSGSDLTKAFFTNASLKSTIFANSREQKTNFHHIRWHNAIDLDKARLGSSSLHDSRVLKLLTTLNGNNQYLTHADLEGVNLADAQLRNANLCGAKLSRATLHEAQLHQANLTESQCIGTDFTAAQLTATCLEAWNIDDTTILTDIDCDFVFLKEQADAKGSRERLPHNPDKIFEPGDFEKYFKEVMDEVKLLIRDGVDPQAFKTAFQALMGKHDIDPANVRGFERKGSDVLIRVAVPPDQSKADVARTFDTHYEKALPESATQKLLEAERKSKQEIIQLANKSIDSISTVLSNLTINTTAMTNSNNPNVSDGSFYAGGDVNLTGSTLNLGEISGQVTNQINQLPTTATDQPNLKDLLTQLQTAIDQDTELSDDEKAEALGEVAKLAKAGTDPKESKMQNLAKRATTTLKAIAETVTDTSKLATACKTLLPMILSLF
ncbi:MAG: pentapeptide repeat-containing protein [Cyanobacteria bacterium P01_C01_bin.118]